jgi:hypothetical protein
MFGRSRVPILAFSAAVSFGLAGLPARGDSLEDLLDDLRLRWNDQSPTKDLRDEEDKYEPLETDRDSFTFATTTVGTGRILVETAYTFIDNRSVPDSSSFPELITRYGLTDRIELRLGWNYEAGGGGAVSSADSGDQETPGLKYESQFSYGFKVALTEQKSWRPESACIIQGTTPTAGPENTSHAVFGYVFGWKFLNDWKFDSAIRYGTMIESGDHFNQWAPSVVLKVPINERWNVHGEYFGIFSDGRAVNTNAQYLSPGITYLITKDCEFGVRLGWGLNRDAAGFFNNVGFGVRF